MKQIDTSATLFGLDMRQFLRELAQAARQITEWPLVRWLSPSYAIQIFVENGAKKYCVERAGLGLPASGKVTSAQFSGVLLPDSQVLWHTMGLPSLAPEAAKAAIELQINSVSPFMSDDLVWMHTPLVKVQNGYETQLAMVSRQIIRKHVEAQGLGDVFPSGVEVWVAIQNSPSFLVLNGYGEVLRRRLAVRWRRINFGLLGFLGVVGFAAAITPTVQLRARAIQAAESAAKLQALVAPAMQQREMYTRLEQKQAALKTQREQSVQPEVVLLGVTKLLPDNTYVSSVQVQGSKVLLTGQTPNGATLMQHLGAQAGVKNVRSPAPTSRQKGADLETFYIEFIMDTSAGWGVGP